MGSVEKGFVVCTYCIFRQWKRKVALVAHFCREEEGVYVSNGDSYRGKEGKKK